MVMFGVCWFFFGYLVVINIFSFWWDDGCVFCGYNKTMRFYMCKIKGLCWYMIVLVMFGIVFGYLMCNIVVVVVLILMEELNIFI